MTTETTETPKAPPSTTAANPAAAAKGDPLAAEGTIHTTHEIEALIPHRYPLLMVDRIVEYDPDARRIVGNTGISAELSAPAATSWKIASGSRKAAK